MNPLANSDRIAIFHLTDVQNTKVKFIDRHMIEDFGILPHLVRHGRAKIMLKLSKGTPINIYAVGLDGRRLGKIPAWSRPDGSVLFIADTFAVTGKPCRIFELTR
jgi:hypothetical protein